MNSEEATRIAKAIAEAQGWPWHEPLQVERRRRFFIFGSSQWHVITALSANSQRVHLVIDEDSRRIQEVSFSAY